MRHSVTLKSDFLRRTWRQIFCFSTTPELIRISGLMDVDLKPRDYQVELVEKALKENGIIFMPTGSGKTFVASLLIKELGGTILTKDFAEGGKRTFFLVNTVQLVNQQALCVLNQTPYSVGKYSGDMNVDFWTKEQWLAEMKNEVLVMTAQIFLNLILHNFIEFRNVNLLILDECHHARNNHTMAQIMKLFKSYQDDRPHVLGLTATLLNSNVKNIYNVDQEIANLESALCAKILTPSDSEVVKRFSTNPTEKVILFVQQKVSHPSQELMYSLTKKLSDDASSIRMPDRNVMPIEIVENAKLMNKKKGWADHLRNMLTQIKVVSEDLGVNAASKCILALVVRFERMKLHATDLEVVYLLNLFITKLHFLRKCLEDAMSECEIGLRPVRYSTPKMKELLGILKNMNKDDSVLVFVELRFTAKVLYYIVEELARNNPDYSHVKPDFIVGYNNNPMNDVKEMMYEKKAQASTMERFNSKLTNVLFASDVIEEGTDISHCNYVLKFDRMKSFRSYVQSKGRARHKDSIYLVFCSDSSEVAAYESYRQIEKKLSDLLARSIRSTIMGTYESDPIEPFAPFGPTGPQVTVYSAISLINRYTSMLPQDKFANLATFWWSRLNAEGRVCAILQLPINSAVKSRIEGPYCCNEADAKRAAALIACRMLFEAGELDSYLLPRGDDSDALHDQEIFSLWPEQEPKSAHKAGTKKRLQLYKMHCPRWVFGCEPRSGVQLYLHVLHMKPTFETYDNGRLEAFKNHIGSRQQFAMLSTKPLPKITEFTLFMNMGEVDIEVFEASKRVVLNEKELNKVFEFHTLLFTEVLKLGRKFFVRDHENAENSYWIVPVVTEKPPEAVIDWETIEKHKGLPEIRPVSSDERATWRIRGSDYYGKVVVPWYRGSGGLPSVRYIVTKVCEKDSPTSPFPSDAYSTYAEYFHLRYGERVVNAHQPLIEVRAISSKINCLKPRGSYKTTSKRKREEGDLEETLIPELCILIEFPAVYILKSTLLPSLLHRLHHIFGAEELRQKIVTEAKLGTLDPPGGKWKKLAVDNFAVQPEEEPAAKSTIGVSDLLNENMEALSGSIYPWKPEDEPKDIEKQLNNIDLLSVIHYNKFLTSSSDERPDLEGFIRASKPVNRITNLSEIPPAEPLKILEVEFCSTSPGPQISEILPAITSIRASDIVNYERLETLGDSFLKFAVSLSLFVNYPEMDEGKLTQIKGKIIGNRNLYYCGRNLGLGERLKARDFVPDEWNIPSFTVVPTLKEILSKNHLSPHPFYGITLTKEEINSGLLSDDSLAQANAVLNGLLDDDSEAHSKSNNYSLLQLGLQPVPDKVIADSVEALLGVYLQSFGTRGAFQMAGYMGILPKKLCQVSELLDNPPPTASRVQESLLMMTLNMIKATEIEKILGYTFKDKSYVLQAFTHSSATHFATDCYQRLEFLGDAVLDFLITMHIYDSCGKLSPGELTDLRSALVNNITFSCLAVKYDLHKHLFSKAYSLTEAITYFAERQAKRGHCIGAEVSFLIEESDVSVAESVEVPKVLGDLFESVVAAVYLDSGKCLKTTWSVVYKLMYNEIKSFSQNVPKNNIRLLYEKFPNPLPTFGKSRVLDDGRVVVPLEVVQYGPNENERKLFTGMGLTKAAAKMAAAKMALRHYHLKAES